MRWLIGLGIIGATVALALNTRKGKQVVRQVRDEAEELKVRARRMARHKAGDWGRQAGEAAFDRVAG